jgi:hypothetical protein
MLRAKRNQPKPSLDNRLALDVAIGCVAVGVAIAVAGAGSGDS